MESFLKWAGGKRWLAARKIIKLCSDRRWVEPFAGSAAMFFSLEPKRAILSDANSDLITTYRVIRDNLDEFSSLFRTFGDKVSKADYYQIRAWSPSEDLERAVRFVYLNRLSWNGLYRVNKRGQFNVPKGTKDKVVLPRDDWKMTSALLRRAELICCDFAHVIEQCGSGDTIFVDPPYTVAHDNNGFLKYNEDIFKWEDQVRLKDSLEEAACRGAEVIVTNADHISVRELYENHSVECLSRSSIIAGKATARGTAKEALIRF